MNQIKCSKTTTKGPLRLEVVTTISIHRISYRFETTFITGALEELVSFFTVEMTEK
jgi:hypothetical protein